MDLKLIYGNMRALCEAPQMMYIMQIFPMNTKWYGIITEVAGQKLKRILFLIDYLF